MNAKAEEATPRIATLIPELMKQIGPIAKAHRNRHHGYAFRSIDDFLEKCQPIFAEAGVWLNPRTVSHNVDRFPTPTDERPGRHAWIATLLVEFDFYGPDGRSVTVGPVVGSSIDFDDKSPGQAHSQALKSALIEVFCIGTGESDAEAVSPVTEGASHSSTNRGSSGPMWKCPACAAAGRESGVWENDSRPYFRCKAGTDCAGARPSPKTGKVFGWSGWHRSFEKCVAEFESGSGDEKTSADTVLDALEASGASPALAKQLAGEAMSELGFSHPLTDADASAVLELALSRVEGAVNSETS